MLNEIYLRAADVDLVKNAVAERGICVARGISTETGFVEFASAFGKTYKHRDADDHAITRVEFDPSLAGKAGFSGFSNGSLEPHTDRSTIENPPELVMLYCSKRAEGGGMSRILDGNLLFNILLESESDLLDFTRSHGCILYADEKNSYRGPIFENLPEDRIRIRFRADGNGYYRFDCADKILRLVEIIKERESFFSLLEGEVLLLNNTRWLHGRTPFSGTRSMLRLLVNTEGWLPAGFRNPQQAQ